MSKPIEPHCDSEPMIPDAGGRWLVLIGDGGEACVDETEAFFAEIWPDVEPEPVATLQ